MVALVTPMEDSGAVDLPALDRLVDWHLEQRTDALVPVGTTGESATLTVAEHHAVIRRVIARVDGARPVIAGTGANATAEAIELTRFAQEAGADACLVVTPYYNKPTQEGLYRHYSAVVRAVPKARLILYNVPGRTGCDMLPETSIRLINEHSTILGIKEATGEPARVQRLRAACGADALVLSGDDPTAAQSLQQGAQGVITVTGNVAPGLMHELCAAGRAGDRARLQECERRLAPLHRAMFLESNPIPVKWCLHAMGLIGPHLRLPLTPLSNEHHAAVRAAMRNAGVLPT